MTDRTPSWKERQDRLGISNPMLALATGISVSAVEKYRNGDRNAPESWVARVETVLTEIEHAVLGGAA